jgi:hypothetical protein
MLCRQSFFVSFSNQFSHTNSLYIAAYVLYVLHLATVRLHGFSAKKMFILIFFLFEHYNFFSHRDTQIDVLWIYKTKVHGAFVLVLGAHF